jgi:hypothetical protein
MKLSINGLQTVNIEGKDFWTVADFAELTQRNHRIIRKLASVGNRLRKLKSLSLHERVYIEADELFNFPFTTGGPPADMGDFVEKFYMEDGELQRAELCLKREGVSNE